MSVETKSVNEVILSELRKEITKMRDMSGNFYAMKNTARGLQYEYMAVGLEQAYRIMASELVGA